VWPRIHALRRQCAEEFARTFGLGHLEDKDDKSVVKRWTIGVDHNYCLPGWGDNFNAQNGGFVDFPGSDHRWRFYEALPLTSSSKPKSVEYASALVSMPYLQRSGQEKTSSRPATVPVASDGPAAMMSGLGMRRVRRRWCFQAPDPSCRDAAGLVALHQALVN
jgi:hypothetical protein